MAKGRIEFRRMTEEEFKKYSDLQLESYAQDRAKAFKTSVEDERAIAKEQTRHFLKDGLNTSGHYLYNVIEHESGVVIGNVWVGVEEAKRLAFLYDIAIHEAYRGKGYGR